MRLFYQTGWDSAAVHFCPHGDSGKWYTNAMFSVPSASGWQSAVLEKAPHGAEFVTCDKEGTQWDNPPPEYGTKNYKTPNPGDGSWTLRHGRLMKVAEGEPVLIVSDLDHTMVGHEHDPDNAFLLEFQALWLGRYAFNGSHLVYSTGRNKADALQVAIERQLLRPKLLLCAVGTEVYLVPDDLPLGEGLWANSPERITLDPEWTEKMKRFERSRAVALVSEFPKFGIRGCPETDPFRIPCTYTVDGEWEDNLRRLREALGPEVEVITSGGAEHKLVDVCSAEGGKLKACQFAMQHLGMRPEQTLVCGDSGNDESMYRCPGIRGVVVGNALPELVEILQSTVVPSEVLEKGRIFKTISGSSVLYAKLPVAGAICEALEAFWPQE